MFDVKMYLPFCSQTIIKSHFCYEALAKRVFAAHDLVVVLWNNRSRKRAVLKL